MYLFQLGHQPHLSIAELEAVFSQQKINYKIFFQDKNYFIIETKVKLNLEELIKELGGTIKIGEKLEEKNIIDFLQKTEFKRKIIFSLSGANSKRIALQTKKELKQAGRSVRFIEPKNTATILHNQLIKKRGDLTIVDNMIFLTKALQPFEEFSQRDYARPGKDDRGGMLPPKLARIMINLAEIDKKKTLLDPFCGSGTILTEALSLGFKHLLANDVSKQAVETAQKNIAWLQSTDKLINLKIKYFNVDASKIDERIKLNSIEAIVSEPYLGKPLYGNEKKNILERQANELRELYLNSFKAFHKILKRGGVAVFVIPKFKNKEGWIEINCINEIKKMGFRVIPLAKKNDSLLYWRPKQHLGRKIWKFEKK